MISHGKGAIWVNRLLLSVLPKLTIIIVVIIIFHHHYWFSQSFRFSASSNTLDIKSFPMTLGIQHFSQQTSILYGGKTFSRSSIALSKLLFTVASTPTKMTLTYHYYYNYYRFYYYFTIFFFYYRLLILQIQKYEYLTNKEA